MRTSNVVRRVTDNNKLRWLKLHCEMRTDSLRCELWEVTPVEGLIPKSAWQIKIIGKVNEVEFVACGRLEIAGQTC